MGRIAPSCFRSVWLALTLLAAPATAFAGEADEAAAEVEGEAHGEHGGPISLRSILREPELWAAAINFALLLIVLRKLGGKSFSEYLVTRRRRMEQDMTEAAELRRKAEARYNEYKERLQALDAELDKLRKDIERAAEDDKHQILAEAEESARRFKRETESLIDQHAKALSAGVRKELVTLATSSAEKVLRETLTANDQQRIADRFKDALRNGGKS